MAIVKVILAIAAIGSTVVAIMLIWSESRSTSVELWKALETMFVIVAVGLTKECVQIKIK